MLSDKQVGIKSIFLVFGMTQPGIEPWSPGLNIMSMKLMTFVLQ